MVKIGEELACRVMKKKNDEKESKQKEKLENPSEAQ